MPASSRTAAQLRLLDTTAVLIPASRSSLTQATEPGNASTPVRSSSSSTRSCLRLPRPQIDSSSAGESGVPSAASRMPRDARNARTPSWRGMPST